MTRTGKRGVPVQHLTAVPYFPRLVRSQTCRWFALLLLAAVGVLLLPALGFAQDAAAAAPPPSPNKGDTAWMLTSTALVLLMSVPGLALFYGGLVRTKNMLSVLMQVFVGFSLITVLWCVYGYSLAFTTGNAFFGGFSRLFLEGTFDWQSGARARRDFQQGNADVRAGVRRVPGHLRSHHLLPDPRIAGRTHQVLRDSPVPDDLVHLRLLPDRTHGLVLGRSGCVHLA